MPNNTVYTYNSLRLDIEKLKKLHRDIPVFSIGQSLLGREIFAIKLGSGPRRIFYCGAHHSLEWITAKVLFDFARNLAGGKYDSAELTKECCLYIVPMVNPDGIEIAAEGKFWQANARGVDINHNYDAMWQLSRRLEDSLGYTSAGPTRYGGEYPESEPESRAIANFTRQNKFDMVMALHSQGEVIYYDFCGFVPAGCEEYLKRFEAVSQYRRDLPEGVASYGGYKDWFIKTYKKPGFTVEIGRGENPLPMENYDEIYNGVLGILIEGMK